MNPNEWELEMNRMLESFASQASFSLRKINLCFEILGRPFDDDFCKYFLEMSNQRLDMSFKMVLFSNKRPVQHNETGQNCPTKSDSAKKQSLDPVKNESDADVIEICDSDDDSHSDTLAQNANGMQNDIDFGHGNENKPFIEAECSRGNEDSSAATIEISGSGNDDDNGHEFGSQPDTNVSDSLTKMNENHESLCQGISYGNNDDTHIDTADVVNENDVKPSVKEGPFADNTIEMVDLPVVEFDPNKVNTVSTTVNGKGKSSKSHKGNTSSNVHRNQSKWNVVKRFKCQHCKYSCQCKSNFIRHQRVHANGRLIGLKADLNGLYHCTLCVRRFTEMAHLSKHMKSHKDNRYLHYCARCLCEFIQEEEKDRHENQCEGRHFECHLCKVFVTTRKGLMQMHMRTHTGAKPFRCMICKKSFQQKGNLRLHLNTVHTRKKP